MAFLSFFFSLHRFWWLRNPKTWQPIRVQVWIRASSGVSWGLEHIMRQLFDQLFFGGLFWQQILNFFYLFLFLFQAFGLNFQGEVWICEILGQGFPWAAITPSSGSAEAIPSGWLGGCEHSRFNGKFIPLSTSLFFFFYSPIVVQE